MVVVDNSERAIRSVNRYNKIMLVAVVIGLALIVGLLIFEIANSNRIDDQNDADFKAFIDRNDTSTKERMELLGCIINIQTGNLTNQQIDACVAKAKQYNGNSN